MRASGRQGRKGIRDTRAPDPVGARDPRRSEARRGRTRAAAEGAGTAPVHRSHASA